jgi:hypothetical protein
VLPRFRRWLIVSQVVCAYDRKAQRTGPAYKWRAKLIACRAANGPEAVDPIGRLKTETWQ